MSEPLTDGSPTPEEIAGGDTPSQEGAESGFTPEDYKQLLQKVGELEGRVSGQTRSFQEEREARLRAERVADEARRAAQDVASRYEEANRRQSQTPKPQVDWEEAMADPARFEESLEKMLGWAAGEVARYTQPAVEGVQGLQGEVGLLRQAAVDTALERGRRAWEESGYEPETWRKVQGALTQHLGSNRQALGAALSDASQVKAMAWYLADNQELPIQRSNGGSSEAPPSASSAPSRRDLPSQLPATAQGYVDRVSEVLKIPGGMELTEDDKRELSAAFELDQRGGY